MYKAFLGPLIALVLVQVLQRLFYIVDTRFVGLMSLTSLDIYNVQYQFFIAGQFLGLASGASALVLLNKDKNDGRFVLKRLLRLHTVALGVFIAVMAVIFPAFVARVSSQPLASWFTNRYLLICLLNVALISISTFLEMTLIGLGKQQRVLGLHILSNILNTALNYLAYRLLFQPAQNSQLGVLGVAAATSLILVVLISISLYWLKNLLTQPGGSEGAHSNLHIREVWSGEFGTIVIRLLAPLLYVYLVSGLDPNFNFLAIYGFGVHLAYLFAMPITGGVQLALRAGTLTQEFKRRFWLISVGSCVLLTAFAISQPELLIHAVYGVQVPQTSIQFLRLYFLATLVGQVAHVLAVPLRRAKKNLWVMANFFISELLIHQGLVFVLVLYGLANPTSLGFAVCVFTLSYLILTVISNRLLPQEGHSLI